MKNITLALGKIEEAMGLIDGRGEEVHLASLAGDERLYRAYKALMSARELLDEAEATQLATILYAPITAEEVERNS